MKIVIFKQGSIYKLATTEVYSNIYMNMNATSTIYAANIKEALQIVKDLGFDDEDVINKTGE